MFKGLTPTEKLSALLMGGMIAVVLVSAVLLFGAAVMGTLF